MPKSRGFARWFPVPPYRGWEPGNHLGIEATSAQRTEGKDRELIAAMGTARAASCADAAFRADIDAGRICVAHFQRRWLPIDKAARILRALCEHPAFADFQADGIDGTIIRDAARDLSLSIALAGDDVERLLDEPGPDDVFEIRGKLYQVNPVTCLLESCEYDDDYGDDPTGGHHP